MQPVLGPNGERLFVPVRIAVLTVSDTRTEMDDKSGMTLIERLTEAGHVLAARTGRYRSDPETGHRLDR
jgi:molybdopterin biosynthesis enzyme MoaB